MNSKTIEARDAFERNAQAYRDIAARGGPPGFAEPVEMGGNGTALELGQIFGRESLSTITGLPVEMHPHIRVVLNGKGEICFVTGADGDPLSPYDAKLILSEEQYGQALNAFDRHRNRMKARIGAALESREPITP